ncbi:MAG: HNH endonuclease, partial [Bryocella sp.]
FSFAAVYGDLGSDFIHVHHVVPVSTRGGEYEVDPIADLIPVCPNCHAMLHRSEPPLSVLELRNLISQG